MADTKDDAHIDRVVARAWLLALMTGALRQADQLPRTRAEAFKCVRRAQGEDEDEWAVLASDVEDILRRLIAHGWLRETPEGWSI